MGKMRALFKLSHSSSEYVVQESNRARAWAAMLLKNDGNHPIIKGARVRWSLTIFPALFLFHACQFSWQAAIWSGHADSYIYPNVRAIGFRDVNVCCVDSSGFPSCQLAIPGERHGLF